MIISRDSNHGFADLRSPNFIYLLFGLLSLLLQIGCSRTVIVEGEVFVQTHSNSPNTKPLNGVQVYFFTERQKSQFEDELVKWRSHSRFQAHLKLSDWDALMEKRKILFAAHAGSDGKIQQEKVSAEVWAEVASSYDQIEELKRIAPQDEVGYWEIKYPSVLNRSEEFNIYEYDLHQIGEDAAWAVTDTNGTFKLSLTLGKVYWVWCSGSTSGQNAPISNPWLFKYVPDGGKLVLSDVNRLSNQ